MQPTWPVCDRGFRCLPRIRRPLPQCALTTNLARPHRKFGRVGCEVAVDLGFLHDTYGIGILPVIFTRQQSWWSSRFDQY